MVNAVATALGCRADILVRRCATSQSPGSLAGNLGELGLESPRHPAPAGRKVCVTVVAQASQPAGALGILAQGVWEEEPGAGMPALQKKEGPLGRAADRDRSTRTWSAGPKNIQELAL